MRPLRVAFGVQDDLQDYATWWFNGPGCLAHAVEIRDIGNAQMVVLARHRAFQVELCSVRGDVVIPPHVHSHADTIEIGVAGAVRLVVNDVDPFAAVPDERLAGFTRGRGIRINHNDRHGGRVLPSGAMFLSVQRWDCPPMSVLTDYVGERDPAANWGAL